MPLLNEEAPALPMDAQGILELAARSMFQLFSSVSQGMFLVDRTCRIVWVNEGYQRFLPDLGFSSLDQFLGRTVEEVIPNTQMRRVLETGQPVLIDLLTNKAGTFVVSRIPLRDEADRVIGAIGIVLFTSIIGIFFIQQNFRRQLIQARKSWNLIFLYLLVALFVPFINATHTFEYWILCAVPLSAFLGAAFLYPAKGWFPLLLHWLMVAFVIAINYFYFL